MLRQKSNGNVWRRMNARQFQKYQQQANQLEKLLITHEIDHQITPGYRFIFNSEKDRKKALDIARKYGMSHLIGKTKKNDYEVYPCNIKCAIQLCPHKKKDRCQQWKPCIGYRTVPVEINVEPKIKIERGWKFVLRTIIGQIIRPFETIYEMMVARKCKS